MKKAFISIIIVFVVVVISYILYARSEIQLISDIPTVFNKSQFVNSYKDGGTFLMIDNKEITPIAHDEQNLYILNGAGDDLLMYSIFKSYYIDAKKKEIVIYKNIVNFKPRQKPCYQLLKIPKKKYSGIIVNNKINVRIKFAFLNGQFELMEYE